MREVYGLHLEGGPIRYVGMTEKGAEARLVGHRKRAASTYVSPIYSWMRKHGPANIRVTVLERCADLEMLRRTEERWIAKLRADGLPLLNLRGGGEGLFAYKWTDEQRAAMSEKMKGRKLTPERVAKMVAGRAGYRHSPETRAKMSESSKGERSHAFGKKGPDSHNFGLVRSAETREKISRALTGVPWAPERHKPRLDMMGENSHQAKLTDADVRAILVRLAAGETQPSIAADYGVHRKTISRINTGEMWTHIDRNVKLAA